MTRIPGFASAVAVLCITAACSLWPAQPPAPQLHDFGPLPVLLKNQASAALTMVSATAPAWLAHDAIHYRLLYDDRTALRSYADHRWAAPPADLLGARLEDMLALGSVDDSGSHSGYALSIELLEFEQDFTSVHDAQVHLELQVSLRRPGDGRVIAQRRFVMTQATSADVQGAISGLAQLADQASTAIAQWARTQTHE